MTVRRKPKNPVIAQSTRLDFLACLHFSFCWNPKEIGSVASEGIYVLARLGRADPGQQLPSSTALYRLPAGGGAQIQGASSPLQTQIKGVCAPASEIQTRREFSHFKPS